MSRAPRKPDEGRRIALPAERVRRRPRDMTGVTPQIEVRPAAAQPGGDPSAVELGTEHTAEDAWTERRRQLHGWFEQAAPNLAPLYAAAVRMTSDIDFPGRVVFVWHAIREIRNRLPDALAGGVRASLVEYGSLTGEIARRWVEDGWPEDGAIALTSAAEPSGMGPVRHEISDGLLLAVARLVASHALLPNRNRANAVRLLEGVAGSTVPPYAVRAWVQRGRRAHKLAHVHNKPSASEDEASLAEQFAAFEADLMAIASRSYENMNDLDAILEAANR